MVRRAKTFTGVVHGNSIKLKGKTDLPEGQQVSVIVEPLTNGKHVPGDGLRKSAGGWADDPEGLDAFLEWNRKQRKNGRRESGR